MVEVSIVVHADYQLFIHSVIFIVLLLTRCILKVLGEVFEKAIMRLRSSRKAPSATSCTLIDPMLPLVRKDL
ncbi:hypothetical protein EYF80_043544 [Liparis tanakae]|uniref:Uncharacterized protein n=1 Tax=Liparis tanakae TaxID=230148 RepID=A0A4Z2G0C2_9TELE|nr:hypothetical protein EYF80_043544 [Liparis tanakae]